MAYSYILYFALLFVAIITAGAVVLFLLLAINSRSRRKSEADFEEYASYSNFTNLIKTN